MPKSIDVRLMNRAMVFQTIATTNENKVSTQDDALRVIGAYYLASSLFERANCREDSKRCSESLLDFAAKYNFDMTP